MGRTHAEFDLMSRYNTNLIETTIDGIDTN